MTQPSTSEEERNCGEDRTIHLSDRELLILALVAEGRTDNEIAIRLCMSAKTVSWYVKEIRARFNARSRTHAVALAMRQGILSGKLSPERDS
jgi:DNA-binding CsgD family transcriptional regulator